MYHLKTTEQIFVKFYRMVGNNPETNRSGFEWPCKVKVTIGQKFIIVFWE